MPIGWAKPRTAPPSTRMVNGATKEPRLNTLVQLCIALEANPSELLEPAGVWSPERLGCASPDDVRLRGAFGQARASSFREAMGTARRRAGDGLDAETAGGRR